MNKEELTEAVQKIVGQANNLKNKHTAEINAPVNYACIFSQSKEEYNELLETVQKIGKVIKKTPTGLLFQISPIKTIAGNLQLLKIRMPDSTRPERGDADFTVTDYTDFKKKYLSKKEFKLIERENFEMIELMDKEFNVRAYFSNPPPDEQFGLTN